MNFLQVVTQIIILFLIMFLGYYLRRRKIISEEGIKSFSALIFYVTMPALIISSLADTSMDQSKDVTSMILASLISYACLIVLAIIVPKIFKVEQGSKGLYRFMTIFSNVGFIGFPMLVAILGPSSVFFGALFNIPYNLLLFTIGIYYLVSDHKSDYKFKISIKQFVNPGIFATLIGLVAFLTGFELPEVVMSTSGTLGRVTTPLAMVVVGGSLYGVHIKGMLKNYKLLIFSLMKMILVPIILGLVLSLIGFSTSVVSIAMVLCGMPIATNTVIIARQYGGNVLEASEAVFLSTLLMCVTTPVLVLLVNLIA